MRDIIVIGSATRDAFFEGVPFVMVKNNKLFKTGVGIALNLGSKVKAPKITFTTGGAGTNAAVTFRRQGFKTAAIVRLGKDVSGEEIKRGLLKEGIDCGMVQIDKKLNTAYSVLFLTESGERTILSFKGCGKNLSAGQIPWSKLKAKWIYVDSLQGNFELLKRIIKISRQKKIRLATNPGWAELKIFKKIPKLLSAFDVFVVNQEEASFLTGIPYQKEKEIFKKLDEMVRGIVCMTKGPEGSVVSNGQFLWKAGCYKEKRIADRTGAGDAFASGFVAGLIQNQKSKIKNQKYISKITNKQNIKTKSAFLEKDIEFAIKFGSANATSVVEYIGAKEGILTSEKFKKRKWGTLLITKHKI